jgi:hypothetical protein
MMTLDPIFVWDAMCPLREYKVHKRGVKIGGDFHVAVTALGDFAVATTVEVRRLPGIPGRLFFGVGGRFKGELRSQKKLAGKDRDAMSASNARMEQQARWLLKTAGQRLLAEGMPGEDDDLSVPDGAPRPAAPAPTRWDSAPMGEAETAEERAIVWQDPSPQIPDFEEAEAA